MIALTGLLNWGFKPSYLKGYVDNEPSGAYIKFWFPKMPLISPMAIYVFQFQRCSKKDARTFEKPIKPHRKLPVLIYNPWRPEAVTRF